MPRWQNFVHVDKIMMATFTDANKFEGILKVCFHIFQIKGILVIILYQGDPLHNPQHFNGGC